MSQIERHYLGQIAEMRRKIAPAKLARHPLSRIWGDLGEADRELLDESIAELGVQQAILLAGDEVLDGWHRLQSAIRAERTEELEFERIDPSATDADLARIAVGLNGARRHLPPRERARIVLETYAAAGVTVADRGEAADGESTVSTGEVARSADVSERTVQRARRDLDESPDAVIATAQKSAQRTAARKTERESAPPPTSAIDADRHAALEELVEQQKGELDVLRAEVARLAEAAGEGTVVDWQAIHARIVGDAEREADGLRARIEELQRALEQCKSQKNYWRDYAGKLEAAARSRDG